MICYMCKSKRGPFQGLEIARLRFIRKAQPHFRDESLLCPKCFQQFESIYKSKNKSKSANQSISSHTTMSNKSARSLTTTSHNSTHSSPNKNTAISEQKEDAADNDTNSEISSVIHFDSRSIDSRSSTDSTDRIVQMNPDFVSIRDSTRKTFRNPNLIVARQGAEAAVRLMSSQVETPPATPTGIHMTDADNDNISADNPSATSVVHFDSHSIISTTSNDTTDRIVQMVPNFITLRDSTRKTAKNPVLNVARQGAEAAVQPAPKRRKTTDNTPHKPPNTPHGNRLQIVDEESSEDEDIASQLSPNNLAHVRPIVRRRKEPVVQQFDDIMDLYIARTSGG